MFRVGISGWTYKGWRGVFYPAGLPHRSELGYASQAFNSIEINGTHYALQRPSSFQRWYDETPPDFIFSVKGSRFITHMKKLRGVETALANFFASGLLCLREKLGPLLWQLPPKLGYDAARLEAFFALLPRDTHALARIAQNHDNRIEGGAFLEPGENRPVRHCMEVRHASFMTGEFFDLLHRHNIAFVFADTAGKWPYAEDLTADFVYIRLHGAEELYVSGYNDAALDWWADRLQYWIWGEQPRDARLIGNIEQRRNITDAFIYFDNDAKVKAPFDAQRLRERLNPACSS